MQLHSITTKGNRAAKRIGRGGTRGKTSGRGHKGQKQHGGHGLRPQLRDIIKKLPKLRGRGINIFRAFQPESLVINVGQLEEITKAGDTVNPTYLVEKGLLSPREIHRRPVKLLAGGILTKAVTVSGMAYSKTAKDAIEKAGGSIVAE